jgi:hypothetical protein
MVLKDYQISGNKTLDLQTAIGWDSSVGIAAGYRVNNSGSKSRCGKDFPH